MLASLVDFKSAAENRKASGLHAVEICAGAGGQALGLERAGFGHAALVEIDPHAKATLKLNRPDWSVAVNGDARQFCGHSYAGVDLFAGGVPCPPFSKAGKQMGEADDRDLFPEALRLIAEMRPKTIMLENVRGLLDPIFADYRGRIGDSLAKLGYAASWKLLHACDFGVSQLRPRVICVAIRSDLAGGFTWPERLAPPPSVGDLLFDLMSERGWKGAQAWRDAANRISPTIVGGSKKHGGADLGPSRARKAWADLGVAGHSLADAAPDPDFAGMPRLTLRMIARLQGFPDDWNFSGGKTAAYRQIGNAFPPPVAMAVGKQIRACLEAAEATKIAA